METLAPSDEALCKRVAERDGGAFDDLVERYQERAYRIAWSIVRDREDAKDCSQEAFIRLHESAGTFAGQAKFSTWFYRILVNCCLDHQPPFVDPIEAVGAERHMSQIWEAVEELSPQQRTAVHLQCREELSTKEIAAVLHLSEATVRVHLHRAYTTLKRRFGEQS